MALVGVNGAGKSTLIRLLSGQDAPTSGTLKLGHNVLAEYFAQDQYKVLDPGARMLDDIGAIARKVPEAELRSLLGCFLFSGEDVFKTLGVLSGGERNRYALAKILVSPANFLLLDEPTNHLDLRAKDVLLEAIKSFTGTVIFVSHDRYFIDRLATRVFEVADGKVNVYPGNYEDYLWRKEGGAEELAAATAAAETPAPVLSTPNGHTAEAAAKEPTRRVNPIKLKQMQDRLKLVEEEIPRVEVSIGNAEQALGVFVSVDETARVSRELEELREKHSSLTDEWEALMEQLQEQPAL
jgi:ATP-binding cassette, subfamily F, member 3